MSADVGVRELSEYFHALEKCEALDWGEVAKIIEAQKECDLSRLWSKAAGLWLGKLAGEQEEVVSVFETRNLIVMSPAVGEGQQCLAKNLEGALASVISYLGSAMESVRHGKMGVLIFSNSHSYSDYIARFYPEGSLVPMSGGLCVSDGYVHVVLFEDEWGDLISMFCHESSHAYTTHLALPMWMDEAIAMRMETLVTGRAEFPLDREIFKRHQKHWSPKNLEKFKSGASWSVAGESFDLSYQLAEILWKKIETNLDATAAEIQNLIKMASWEDAGEKALQKIFGIGLDDLIRSFLGGAVDR